MCETSGLPHLSVGLYGGEFRSFGSLLCYSRIILKNAGGGTGPVTDLPASTVLSSLQLLALHVFPTREPNVIVILACYKKQDFQ